MHVICPHCHGPIELVRGTGEEILCPSCGSTFRIETETTVTWIGESGGRTFGRFELKAPVGSGAVGTVYKAYDPKLDRVVALKVPRAGNLGESVFFVKPGRLLNSRIRRSSPSTRSASTTAYPTWSATSSTG